MTRIIVMATPNAGRNDFIKYLKSKIHDVEFCMDQHRSARETFERSLLMAGQDPCIHMEEDVLLTKGFREKIEAAIAERPNDVIQFFSRSKHDQERGSRYINVFSMNQCYYFPAGFSLIVYEYCKKWPGWQHDPNGYDTAIEAMRKQEKFKIWCHVPSLVQHRISPSLLGPRAQKRISGTFTDPDL